MTGTLTPSGYRPRVVDREVAEALYSSPAVLLDGPRASGKTWTGKHFAQSEALFDTILGIRLAASIDAASLLDGPVPRLLDEWQQMPEIWNPMRRACDDRAEMGQFLLTGSANPPDDITRHSGIGRVARVRIRPMSLLESGESNGSVSLSKLMDGEPSRPQTPGVQIPTMIDLICRGGWPRIVTGTAAFAQKSLRDYLNDICRTDITQVDDVKRDPIGVRRLLASLGRNAGTKVSFTTLAKDASGDRNVPMHPRTVKKYLQSLERLFVIEDLPAWKPHLRSRIALRTTPARHFVCPSLAVAALRTNSVRLRSDLDFFGFLFESLVVRDLRIYSQLEGCHLSHYLDEYGLEVDVILERADGEWAAFEIKLGSDKGVMEGIESLRLLKNRINTNLMGEPIKLAVITATGVGGELPDGIAIIPITTLGP
ncbi:MAG: ATP-binding protein [Acidimicrobiia bacterium]|nr:ATP-binding protein [Acidimicrobiia bacterium]